MEGVMLERFRCVDENIAYQNIIIDKDPIFYQQEKAVNKTVFIDLVDEESIVPSQLASSTVTCTTATATATTAAKSQLALASSTAITEVVATAKANKVRVPKPRQPKAATSVPAKLKAEKEFEKLALSTRLELLRRWGEEIKLETSACDAAKDKLPAVETSDNNACSDATELSNLRIQLGDVVNKMQELQSKEKRLKSAIKKLQRKVCASSLNLVSAAGPEPLEVVLNRLFTRPLTEVVGSCVALSMDKAPLWLLTQQHEQYTAYLHPRRLYETRYQSLDSAGYEELNQEEVREVMLVDLEEEAAVEQELSHMQASCPQPNPKTGVEASFLSQLLVEFSTQPAANNHLQAELPQLQEQQLAAIDATELIQVLLSSQLGTQIHHAVLAAAQNKDSVHSSSSSSSSSSRGDKGKKRVNGMEEMLHDIIQLIPSNQHPAVEVCLGMAWLLLTGHLPGSLSATDTACSFEYDAHELSGDAISFKTAEGAGSKRGLLAVESADSEECFTQLSAKKKSRLELCSTFIPFPFPMHMETVDLLSPQPGKQQEDVVVDLCMDDSFVKSDEVVDVTKDQPQLEILNNSSRNYSSTYSQKGILDELQAMEFIYELQDEEEEAPPQHRSHPPTASSCSQPNAAIEPAWAKLSDEELHAIAQQYGLKPAPKTKLIRLLKSMWGRLHGCSMPLSTQPTGSSSTCPNSSQLSSAAAPAAFSLTELKASLSSNRELFEKVLLFVPVELDEVHAHVRSQGHNVSKLHLLPMLDMLSVFVSTGNRNAR